MTATLPPPVVTEAAPPPDPTPAPPPPRRPPLPAWRVVFAIAWLTLAALALWSVCYVLVISNLQHTRTQHELYSRFRTELANAVAPIGGLITPGRPVAVLDIPDADLHGEVVVEGTSSSELRSGPGHLRSSPLPGQPGVSVIYGRAVSFGAPFGKLPDLRPGAQLRVTTDQGVFHYRVRGARHEGDPWVLPVAGQSELTLVTSEGGWSPTKLIYVDAVLDGKPAPDPGGRLSGVPPQELAMATEHGTTILMRLVLWLQLLVAVAVLLTWLHSRWRATQLWLIGVPLVLAALWGLSDTAVRMLPNLL
jgi:sortase A